MLERRKREDKDEMTRCPFCKAALRIPAKIETVTGYFIGGRCDCGAVYACDPSGHNVGEAYLDALSYACGEDLDKVYSLDSDKDYSEAVFDYDLNSHKMREIRDIRRDFSGKIIFIKLGQKRINDINS